MANISASLKNWSTTAGSNQPDSGDTATVQADLQAVQAAVRSALGDRQSVASAGTTDLGSVDSLFVNVTGTTGITGFGTLSAGILKVVTFAGALTITHNATSLILPGAASITTAAGDSLLAESLGSGNWKVHLYQKADGTAVVSASTYDYSYIASNLTISTSRAGSTETIALKTKAGADPSANDPIKIGFRNSTIGTGDYTILTISAATSLTISSGSTMGMTNSVLARLWLVGFNDAGTFRLGLVNCLSGTSVMSLRDDLLYSSTAEGGAGAADNAQTIYTGTAVTSKAMRILGYLEYTLGTVGTWGTAPSKIQIFGPGIPLPNTPVQKVYTSDSAVATGTTVLPADDTIPQNTEGDQYQSQAITPTSAANILDIESLIHVASTAADYISQALFQDSTANALKATMCAQPSAGLITGRVLTHRMLAGTASSTTFKVRAGSNSAGTTTYNGFTAARKLGGVMDSHISVTEVMA